MKLYIFYSNKNNKVDLNKKSAFKSAPLPSFILKKNTALYFMYVWDLCAGCNTIVI